MEISFDDVHVGRGVLAKYTDGEYYPANVLKVLNHDPKGETWLEVNFVGYNGGFAVKLPNVRHPASHFGILSELQAGKEAKTDNDEERLPVAKRRKNKDGTWAQSSIGARARRFERRKDKQEAYTWDL